jgi:2-polyprenyl-3-methyl-5-hydroxy-6-metoxy-1,4-benzoquinol methylase
MSNVSNYNQTVEFDYQLKESRLIKVEKLINSLTPGKMLDIGCSKGVWGTIWKQRGWDVSGIDIDTNSIDISIKAGINAKFCDLNKDKIPFEGQAFDLIFAGEVIEHLVDTDGFILELYRCLRPGGRLILTTPNLVSFENRMRILFGIYPIWVDYSLQGVGHVRAYTPKILINQLKNHGLELVKHTGNWVPFIPQKYIDDVKLPFLSWTGSMFPNLSMDIIVMVEKGTMDK